MSRFTLIKIKINKNEQPATLLAEYGGDFDIKIWILEKSVAWTGELSSLETDELLSHFKLTKEVFLEELQRALTTSDPAVLYSIDEIEDKGYVMSWKKCLNSGITIKNGEITLGKVSKEDVYDEVIERSFEHNSQLQSQIDSLQREREDLLKEKENVLTRLEKVVNQKESFEKNVFSQFLSVLNAKKKKIFELQEIADQVASSQSKGTSSKEILCAVKKEPVTEEGPSLRQRNTQEKKNDIKKEEVDPYEVDTDVEEELEDETTPRANKRDSTDVLSQSFSLGSFDEVSSPVLTLPKRSKLNPKGEEVKRSLRPSPKKLSEKAETEEELVDQL